MIDIRLSDNLELMAEIKDNTIDLIYCDILYGTGRKFKDYQDLKPIRSEIEAHYLPRIKEMHRILKDTGSIYLQMDTRINHWIRCIMDDIFGYDNFVYEIAWCYNRGGLGRGLKKTHDCIEIYSKNVKKFTINDIRVPYKKGTRFVEKNGDIYKQYNKDKLTKVHKDGKLANDYWVDIPSTGTSNKETLDYATKKPKALLERIIKASSNEGDLVADFYLGSGTTAEVCLDLNRNFIGCDISEKAVAIGLERTKAL